MTSPEARVTPVFSHINVGSYTGSQFGTPPVHILSRSTPTYEDFHSCRDGSNSSSGYYDVIGDSDSTSGSGEHQGADQRGDTAETGVPEQRKSTVRQIMTLVILVAGSISSSMFYSLLAPFFATEATRKGATLVEVGLIYGSFQFIQFLMSPVFGNNMTHFGSKYLFVAGNFMCSGCGILFGCLQWSPDGVVYVVMCFVIRSVEAVAAAAQNTATFAIGAYSFPDNISVIMGVLQAASCVGLVCGPPIGGLLYSQGGYYLPFVVCGGMFMFFSICSLFFLPTPHNEKARPAGNAQTKLRLLRIPIVPIVGCLTLVAQATIGFIDVALAQYLRVLKDDMSTVRIGLIFLIPALIVVVTAPIFGFLGDKYSKLCRPFMIFGALVGGVGFLGLGPCPLLYFLPAASVKQVMLSLAISALGWGSLVLTYQEYINAAKFHGFPDGMETQGIISGVNGAFNSLGALLGPTLGGLMVQQLEFPWAASAFAFSIILMGVLLLLFIMCDAAWGSSRSRADPATRPAERTPLLTD